MTPDSPFIVLCAGMPRSASTWSFNVCRHLLRDARGPAGVHSGYFGEGKEVEAYVATLPADPAHLIKSHHPTAAVVRTVAAGGGGVVFTIRNPMQAAASMRTFFGSSLPAAIDGVLGSLSVALACRHVAPTLFLAYSDVIQTPSEATRRIAAFLDRLGAFGAGGPSDAAVAATVAATRAEAMAALSGSAAFAGRADLRPAGHSRYDPETLLHVGHVARGTDFDWEATLGEDEASQCRHAFAPWRDFLDAIGCRTEIPGA